MRPLDPQMVILWRIYWPGDWPPRLDRFRTQVGDDAWEMWELAEPFCRDTREIAVIRHAIERVCGPIQPPPMPQAPQCVTPPRQHAAKPKLVKEPPPEKVLWRHRDGDPDFREACGGGSRHMGTHVGPLPSLEQYERMRPPDFTMRRAGRNWYDDWRRRQQRAYA
jgi:hypothetical protein